MNTIRLNPLDTAWIFTETRATPNHVGGLLQFRLPADAPKDFMRQMMAEFRNHRTFTPPWNRRLKYAFNKNPAPVWIEDDDIDLEYHVRHAALPWPGGERELGELVGRLQSTPLDLMRPPWECTLIEGLEGHRFAMFIKMHHSLIDGISGMKLLQRAMSTDRKRSLDLPPFWASGTAPASRAGKEPAPAPTMANAAEAAVAALSGQARSLPQLAAAFGKMLKRVGDHGDGMVLPFVDSPLSVLNGRVREKRRFATQHFTMERLRTLAAAAGGTLNDVVLAICGGALRRFLAERDTLPEASLTAGIPVSVRPADDEGTGNAITFIIATLGTDIADPAERFQAIRRSVRHAKEHVQSLPRQAMEQYTMLLDGADADHAADRRRRAHAADVQHHDLQCARPGEAAVFPWRRIAGHLPGLHRHPRPGGEHHLPELRRHDEFRLHRLPHLRAPPATPGGVHGGCPGGIGSRLPARTQAHRGAGNAQACEQGHQHDLRKSLRQDPSPAQGEGRARQAQDGLTRAGGSMPRYGAGLIAAVRSTCSAAMPPASGQAMSAALAGLHGARHHGDSFRLPARALPC
jgi:diacylglycerol O-acyltransferase